MAYFGSLNVLMNTSDLEFQGTQLFEGYVVQVASEKSQVLFDQFTLFFNDSFDLLHQSICFLLFFSLQLGDFTRQFFVLLRGCFELCANLFVEVSDFGQFIIVCAQFSVLFRQVNVLVFKDFNIRSQHNIFSP